MSTLTLVKERQSPDRPGLSQKSRLHRDLFEIEESLLELGQDGYLVRYYGKFDPLDATLRQINPCVCGAQAEVRGASERWRVQCPKCGNHFPDAAQYKWLAVLSWNRCPQSAAPPFSRIPLFGMRTLDARQAKQRLLRIQENLDLESRRAVLRRRLGFTRTNGRFQRRMRAYLQWSLYAEELVSRALDGFLEDRFRFRADRFLHYHLQHARNSRTRSATVQDGFWRQHYRNEKAVLRPDGTPDFRALDTARIPPALVLRVDGNGATLSSNGYPQGGLPAVEPIEAEGSLCLRYTESFPVERIESVCGQSDHFEIRITKDKAEILPWGPAC